MKTVVAVVLIVLALVPAARAQDAFAPVLRNADTPRVADALRVLNMTTNDPGGPLNSTKPLVLMIYQTAFASYDMGYAAAQTVVLFVILLIVSLIQLRILRDR